MFFPVCLKIHFQLGYFLHTLMHTFFFFKWGATNLRKVIYVCHEPKKAENHCPKIKPCHSGLQDCLFLAIGIGLNGQKGGGRNLRGKFGVMG